MIRRFFILRLTYISKLKSGLSQQNITVKRSESLLCFDVVFAFQLFQMSIDAADQVVGVINYGCDIDLSIFGLHGVFSKLI